MKVSTAIRLGFFILGLGLGYAVCASGVATAATSSNLAAPLVEILSNGLKVAWFVSDRLPIVDISLVVDAGHTDDLAGKSGTAALLGAALDRGAGGLSALELALAFDRLGASRLSSPDSEQFSVGVHGFAPDVNVLLTLLGKMALEPALSAEEVEKEKSRIADEWKNIGDSAEGLASLLFQRKISANTPYERGGLASLRELNGVTRDDVFAFHHTHFVPENALLLVVGRVDRVKTKLKIEEVFGRWTGKLPVQVAPSKGVRATPTTPAVWIVDRPGLTQAHLRIGFRAPLMNSSDHYALVVANAMIGELFNSRLNLVLRDELGLTYGIGSAFSYSRALAVFGVSAATRNEAVGELVSRTVTILDDFKKSPASVSKAFADEVTASKEFLTGGFPLATSTLGRVAGRWLVGEFFELGPDYLNEFASKVNQVTPEQVVAAASKHFDLEHLSIVIAGDQTQILKSLQGAKERKRLGEIKTVTVQQLL